MNTRAEGSLSRLSGRLLVFVWAAILLGATGAKATPVKTMVQDTLYRADGSVAQGMITIRWNAFSTGAGEAVPMGMVTETIGSNGSISIPLIPNTGASPSGSYYRVFMKLDDGTTSEELWVVPAVATTTVAAIRSNVVPQAVAAQFVSRDYVDSKVAALGTVANLATPGAIGATTPGTVNATSYAVNGSPLASTNLSDVASLVKTSQANTFAQRQTVSYTGGDTVGAALTVDASNSTLSTNPALKVAVPASGGQEAFQAVKGTDSNAWYSLEYNVAGPALAGISMGPGGSSGRDTLLYRSGVNALTTPGTLDLQSSITASSPVVDVRAFGAVIDGVTDIGQALSAATAQACATSGVVMLPCTGNGCYLANGSSLAGSNGKACGSQAGIQYKLQGVLKLGTTLITPDNTQWVSDGGGFGGQFVPRGPNANIVAPAVYGSLGTAVSAAGSATITPTMTGGTVAQMPVGTAITVAGNKTCSIASIARNSVGLVTATLSANECRIPAGTVITVAGVTGDTTFNTTPTLLSSDFYGGVMTWSQPGTADSGTANTGTVTGLNDDTFETVLITANNGFSITAQFAHAHASTDSFGAVGVMAAHNFTQHYFQGISVGGNYGAGFWFGEVAELLMDGVAAGGRNYIASIPIELASTFNFHITHSSFLPTLGHGCGTSCGQQSYPYGMRLTNLYGAPDYTGGIVDGESFIGGGVKIDNNGLTSGSGNTQSADMVFNTITIEQPAGEAFIWDSRVSGTSRAITLDHVTMQDDFNGNADCLFGYTDPHLGGQLIFNTLESTLLAGCLTNSYYGGSLLVNGIDFGEGSVGLPRYLSHVGTLNDGTTTETELRGEGAGMSPSLIPYATQNVTTNPASWTCSGTGCSVNTGLEAPDGTMTAGELVTGSTASYVQVMNYAVTPVAGDWLITGVWCMPGVNSNAPCSYGIQANTSGSGMGFNNGSWSITDSSSNYYNDWWHPVVSADKITTGASSSIGILMRLSGVGSSGWGMRYWMPFFIYVPVSAKPSSMTTQQWDGEIARWRQQLLHGVVPPNMPANVLAMNPSLKMMWGSDTNLYRGAAGVVQTDGSFNVNGSGAYQVNGTATLPITSFTTIGTSGAASLSGGVLNIPQYAGGSGSGVVGSGTAGQFGYYSASGTAVAGRTIVATDIPTLNQNTTGTAGNLSGTPALPNGVTATTQAGLDNSTKLATTAYTDSAVGVETAARVAAEATKVATSTTVNGHALSSNVTLGVADLGASYGADITSNGGVLDSDGTHATSTGCTFYGDSITAGIGATVAANDYTSLLTTRLCGGTVATHGTSGDAVGDGIYRVLTYSAPGDSGDPAVTMLYGVNDATYYTSPTSTNKASFTQFEGGAAAWLALSGTNKVMANNTGLVTQGGATWTADTTFADAHGLTTTGTSTLTDSNCYVGPKGVLYLWYYLYGSSTGTFTVSVDGATQTDTITGNSTLSAQYQSNAPRNVGATTAGLARFAGIANGSHTCAVNASGATGGTVGMIAFGFPPTNRIRGPLGPNVYMGGVLPQMNNANASNVVTYNGYALGVSTLLVGDGLPVKFVDVYDSVDPYLDFASTAVQNCPASTAAGLHPNDCGHNKLFDVFSTSIKPTTIIPLNQSAPTTANLWNWNPTANTGQAASMPGGDVYYYASNAVGGVTFGQLSLTATESGSHPMGYALNIFSGGNLNNTGTSLCYTTAANVGLNGLYCNFDVYQGTLYTLPTSTSDATSTSNLYGGKQVFRTRSWSGSAAANEDYTLQTSPSANGSGADVYFTIKNSTATTTGAKGLWVQNTGNHGWKLEAGNSSYDATLDTTAMTGAATIQPPAGWTGTVSLQAGLNLPNGTPTYAAGTGVTSVGCASGYSCTNTRGELTIVGGSATTGTIATVNFSAALAAAPGLCQVTQNGGTTFFGIGEGQPTSTAFTVTAGNSVASSTVTVDYRCTP